MGTIDGPRPATTTPAASPEPRETVALEPHCLHRAGDRMKPKPAHLDQIERWMQSVITHPGGVADGVAFEAPAGTSLSGEGSWKTLSGLRGNWPPRPGWKSTSTPTSSGCSNVFARSSPLRGTPWATSFSTAWPSATSANPLHKAIRSTTWEWLFHNSWPPGLPSSPHLPQPRKVRPSTGDNFRPGQLIDRNISFDEEGEYNYR